VWYRIPSPPGGARQEVAAAVVGGKVYVVGGLVAGGKNTSLVERFDPASETWSRVAALPDGVDHAMAAELGGRLVVMGGFSARAGRAASRSVFVFDAGKWSAGPPMTEARAAGAAVRVGKKIYVVGGIAGSKHLATTESFDGSTWRSTRTYASSLDHVAAATDGKRIFVAGGRAGGNLEYDTFQVYEPGIAFWSPLRSLPTGRSGLGAAFVNGSVVVVGGEGSRIFGEVEAYGYAKAAWRRLPTLRVPRHGIGVVAVGRTIYTFVGGDKPGLAPSAVCEAIDL
jgi:non-specific serine/threonine protein kinase